MNHISKLTWFDFITFSTDIKYKIYYSEHVLILIKTKKQGLLFTHKILINSWKKWKYWLAKVFFSRIFHDFKSRSPHDRYSFFFLSSIKKEAN